MGLAASVDGSVLTLPPLAGRLTIAAALNLTGPRNRMKPRFHYALPQ
jgi:hypothetical protein